MTFKELEIIEPILRALEGEGYTSPTPIQEQSIPILLKRKDLLGAAQTGTGKTAAFAIPILQHLYLDRRENKERRKIKALIITPTLLDIEYAAFAPKFSVCSVDPMMPVSCNSFFSLNKGMFALLGA